MLVCSRIPDGLGELRNLLENHITAQVACSPDIVANKYSAMMTNVNRFLRRLCWHRAARDDHTVRLNKTHIYIILCKKMISRLNINLEQGLAAIEKLGQEALNEPKIYVSTILEVRVLFCYIE